MDLQALTYAIVYPLHEAGIETYYQSIKVIKGPTTYSFGIQLVKPSLLPKTTNKKMRGTIETLVSRIMNVPMGQSISIRIYHQGQFLMIEIPRPDPWRPTYEEMREELRNEIFLGMTNQGISFYIDLFNMQGPGMFIVGASGSGKSNAARLVIFQAILNGCDIAIADLKGGESYEEDLGRYANLGIAYNEADALILFQKIKAISDGRNEGRLPKDTEILVVFDEIPRTPVNGELQKVFQDLCASARSAKIRFLGIAQRAGKEIHPQILQNLSVRLVGKVMAAEAPLATGVKRSGADKLFGYGDMLFIVEGEIKGRLQVPRADAKDISHLLAARDKTEAPVSEEEKTSEEAEEKNEEQKIKTKKSIEQIIEEAEAILKTTKKRAKFPPKWLIHRAYFEARRKLKYPLDGDIRKWSQKGEGKVVSKNQRKLILDIIQQALPSLNKDEGGGDEQA